MANPGCFVVRAVVADAADRNDFDRWYEEDHLPDALKTFGAARAWRYWSRTDPSVHTAFYAFDNVAAAEAVPSAPGLKRLIADFDGRWGTRVTRSREIFELAGEIEAGESGA